MRFSHREQSLFLGLVFFVIIWGLFVFAIKPALSRIEVLTRVIPEKTEDLEYIKAKSQQYFDLQAVLERLETKANAQDENFELLTFLESTINRHELSEKVTTIKQKVSPRYDNYTEVVVEFELENISLDEMMKLLLKVQSSDHFLQVKSLYTKKNMATSNSLDSVIQISTFTSN